MAKRERGPAGFFLDKMIEAAEALKTSAEYFAGRNIFPFSTTAGEAIPGSTALGAAGSQAQVDLGGLPKGFGLLDALSFMGINSRMLGLSTTGPYPTGEAIDAPPGFKALPTVDPTIAKNVQEANDALEEQEAIQGKLNEQFKRYMENVMLAESGRRGRTGSVAISQYEQQELINEAKRIAETFGDDARMTFQKAFPEVFDKEFSDKFVGPMEKSAYDRAKEEDENEKILLQKEEALLNVKMEHAKTLFDRENERLDAEEKEVEEQLRKDKALAKAPQGVSFRGGSVEEFQFLRQMTQRSEEAQAIREAAAKAEAQRERINADRKAALSTGGTIIFMH